MSSRPSRNRSSALLSILFGWLFLAGLVSPPLHGSIPRDRHPTVELLALIEGPPAAERVASAFPTARLELGISDEDSAILRWVLVRQNPWSMFDPEGLDAVYVAFPDHPILVPKGIARAAIKHDKQGFSTDLGHAGVLLINPESGKADYYEFGRYDPKLRGLYRKNDRGAGTDTLDLPNIKFGKDGKPTKDSFEVVSKRLSEAIAGEHGKPEKLEMAYFSSSKKTYEKQKVAADAALESNNDPNRPPYTAVKYNCGDFARETINAGEEIKLKDSKPRPKYEVTEHQKEGGSYTYTPSEGLKENEKKKR